MRQLSAQPRSVWMANSSASKVITGFVLIQWQYTYYSC